MYFIIIKYYIIYLYILVFCVTISACFTTKHNKYKQFVIEDSRLCSEVAKRKIELKKDTEEALLVTQTTTKDHSADWTKNLYCKFEVHSDSGLFATIQSINFRFNSSTNDCIDYVKFETRQASFNKKLCKSFNVVNSAEIFDYYNAIDSYGHIETTIFISKERLKLNEKMDLKIVYTKYKRCNAIYSPCKNQNNKECIHNELFNDSFVNCPVDDCFDESSCSDLRQRLNLCDGDTCPSQYGGTSTKVILSAVTSLVVSFLVFIICIWVCRKTGKLCWSASCSETARSRQPSRVIEMQNRSETSVAPPNPELPASPDPEKDLPPSYDSLFPSR